MLLTIAGFLPVAVEFGAGRMRLAVLLPVIGMLLAPVACAFPASFAVFRIGRKLLSAVAGTALLLANGLAADDLRRLTTRRGETFVAVRATPFDHSGVVAFQCDQI